MILALSFEKRGGIVDDAQRSHKPFCAVAVSETLYRKSVARSRFICEAHEFLEGVRADYPEHIVRQHARNAGLSADGPLDEVRLRLAAHVLTSSEEVMRAHADSASLEHLKTVLSKAQASLTPAPEVKPSAPVEPHAPVAPPQPPAPPAPEPLTLPEHIAPEAWERLHQAWEAQDYKAARSALASVSDDPTPSKATELWEAVEAILRERGMIE